MCDCAPSSSMPFAGQWVLRGGFTPRVSPRRPNAYFPHQDIFRQSRDEFFISFYHRSQESAKIFDAMKRRVELAYEQRRKSEASRLQKAVNGNVVLHLERIPLSRNVTLTIEIPNTEHAGMMERMEAWCDEDSIPQIMQDTGVLIQFPDLIPEIKNAKDYVNRVTLTGPLSNVEQARIRIRNFTPIAISFPLRTLKPNILIKDVKNIIDKAIAEKLINFPNLEIMVESSQLPKDSIPSCIIRGTSSHERDICDACAVLHRLLFDAANDSEHSSAMIYSTVMDIPVVQQLAVTGKQDGCLIRTISLETNAIIYFPTISDHRFGATVFYLYGSVHAIMRARKYIQGLLPVRLIFDVENNDLLCPIDASDRELFLRDTEHDLTIIMKKSRLEGEKITANDTLRNMVIIESGEYNLTNVYAMRHHLLRDHILEDEPLIVTKDFDFFDRDFKTLIARNNQVIIENMCSNDSQTKISSSRYSRLNQSRESSSLPQVPVISSSVINDVAELLPHIHASQEILQLSKNENIPISVTGDDNSASQEKTAKETIISSTSPSSIISKQQYALDGINVSVPQFLDLFKQNENKSITMIPIDDAGKSLSKIAIPQKIEYIRNINKITAGQSDDKHLERCNFDMANNNTTCNLTNKTIPENMSESKYLSEKSPEYMRLFTAVPQNLIGSGINVVEDQDSTTIAVATAMLQNSPSQGLFQSSGTAVKSSEYFAHMPRMWKKKTISKTFARPAESAQNAKASSPEKIWQTKKNLPLKSSLTNENYIHEYQCYISANATSYMPQEISAREPREATSDARLSSSSSNYNNTLYSILRSNLAQNSNQHRLLHSNKDNSDDAYDYRKELQTARTCENFVWKNSRHSSLLSYAHSNTNENFSEARQACQNSLRSTGMKRSGRMMKQSMNHSAGHYSTFSHFQSTCSLSSAYSEGKRYSNRAVTNFHLKRQFVKRTQLKQLKEKEKDDEQEEEYFSLYQKQQHGRISDQFQKECEELKKNVNSITPPSAMFVRTKTYADITKRVDVMVVQRNQNEPSLRSIQQLNRPALMMKELEKYTGSDKTSSKSYADMAKKSAIEKEEEAQPELRESLDLSKLSEEQTEPLDLSISKVNNKEATDPWNISIQKTKNESTKLNEVTDNERIAPINSEIQEENKKPKQSLNSEVNEEPVKPIKQNMTKEKNGRKKIKCTVCEKEIIGSLKYHMRIHTGEKPYNCSDCEKSFARKEILKNHMRIHTGEKPYNCSDCWKSFSQLSNLQTHKRTHTGEKPYNCSDCGKSFSDLSNLQAHKRSHTSKKPYNCSDCGKSFARQEILKNHMRSHSGEKPYSCSECGKSFAYKCSLKKHALIH